MTEDLITAGTVAAAVAAGAAGVLFAFSTSVMPARRRGMAAMQAMNSAILNPLFGLVFGGAAVLCGPWPSRHRSRPTSHTRFCGASAQPCTWSAPSP